MEWWLAETVDLLQQQAPEFEDEQAFDLAEALHVTCGDEAPRVAVLRLLAALPKLVRQ